MAKLYIVEDGKTAVYEILENEVALGRGAANQVQLRDRRASKRQGVVRQIGPHWKFVDLESKNGTRVNGQFRNQHWLRHGDTLTIGRAVIRFDAEGAAAAPPPAGPAVPVAAAPARPAPVAPATRPAPPVPPARPASPARPTPPRPVPARPAPPAGPPRPPAPVRGSAPARPATPPRPARAAPARGAPSRGGAPTRGGAPRRYRERQVDDGTGEPMGRVPRKRGMSSGTIALLGTLGAVAFIVIMFLAMHTSVSKNKQVWLHADDLAKPPANDYQAAIAYAEQNADPYGEDYDRVQKAVDTWKKAIQAIEKRKADAEAAKWLHDNVEVFTRTTGHNPLNRLPDAEIAKRLRELVDKFPKSEAAQDVLHAEAKGGTESRPAEPWYSFWQILKNNPEQGLDVQKLLLDAKEKAAPLASSHKYGEAMAVYDDLLLRYGISLDPELLRTLSREAEQRKKDLALEARSAFDEDMGRVRSLEASGETSKARGQLNAMLENYAGLAGLVQEAEDELSRLP